MNVKNMRDQLARLTALVDGWTDGIPAIERDLALDKLKALYEAVKTVTPDEPLGEREAVAPPPSPEVSIRLDDLLAAEVDLHDADLAAPFTGDLPLPEPALESVPTPEPAAEPEAVSAPEPIRQNAESTARLFDTDDMVPRHREKRRVIMSLYDSDVSAPFSGNTPLPEPPVQPTTPAPSEASAAPKIPDTAPILNTKSRIADLRSAIGLNDRYLLVADLFGGNEQAYDETIDRLDRFDNLEDCLIHIAENYDWNPAGEGVRLLMELLERKLQ